MKIKLPFFRQKTPEYTPTPQLVSWRAFAELNERRVKRWGEGARITPDEWIEGLAAQHRPKPKPMTRAEVMRVQEHFYRTGKEPLSEIEILELTGYDMSTLEERMNAIETNYQAELQRGEAEIARYLELGMAVPNAAHDVVKQRARDARNAAIRQEREDYLPAVQMARENHGAIRHAARLAATPPVTPEKAAQANALMAQCRSLRELQRLHADALTGRDEALAYHLEVHGHEILTGMDVDMWRVTATEQRDRRAAPHVAKLQAIEDEIRAGLNVLNSHPLSDEAEAFAQRNGFKDADQFLNAAGISNLAIPPAEPIF